MDKIARELGWRYEIKYGPEGEANYAWIYRGKEMIATMLTHHAAEIVKAMNSPAFLASIEGQEPVETNELGYTAEEWDRQMREPYPAASPVSTALENARLREALEEIAISDDVENMIDPNRNKRLALAALGRKP